MAKPFQREATPKSTKPKTSRLFCYMMRDRDGKPYYTWDLTLCGQRQLYPTFHQYVGRALKAPIGWPEDGPGGPVLAPL